MKLADKLNRLLRESTTGVTEVARRANVSKSSLYRWLNGASYPPVDEALRLARVLGVPLDYLADDELDECPAPATAEITEDERAILEVFRAMGLSRTEAVQAVADTKAMKVIAGITALWLISDSREKREDALRNLDVVLPSSVGHAELFKQLNYLIGDSPDKEKLFEIIKGHNRDVPIRLGFYKYHPEWGPLPELKSSSSDDPPTPEPTPGPRDAPEQRRPRRRRN